MAGRGSSGSASRGSLTRGRLVLVFLTVALACGGLWWLSNWLGSSGERRVPVRSGEANWFSSDLETVITELYPYQVNRTSEEHYIVSGAPLAFAFPRAAYASYVNGEGGPQAAIDLRVDRRSMQPIGVLMHNAGVADHSLSIGYRDYQDHDLALTLHSNLVLPSASVEEERWLSPSPDEEIGTICGFKFQRKEPTPEVYSRAPPTQIGQRWMPFGTYHGVAIGQEQKARIALCMMSAPICRIGIDYQGRQVRFSLPRAEICDHDRVAAGIVRFLDDHRTEGAAP